MASASARRARAWPRARRLSLLRECPDRADFSPIFVQQHGTTFAISMMDERYAAPTPSRRSDPNVVDRAVDCRRRCPVYDLADQTGRRRRGRALRARPRAAIHTHLRLEGPAHLGAL